MINLTLKKCTSEPNKMTKSFVAQSDIALTGYFKEKEDLLHPVIQIETTSDLSQYNYAEITEFNRKYFMHCQVDSNKLWTLYLDVDVLSTYATEIKNCKAIVKRTQKKNKINYYMNDGVFFTEQRQVVTYHTFKKVDPVSGKIVNATLGSDAYYLLVAGG